MTQYIEALESFDTECKAIYADYAMESFAPTGAMESISERAKQAWHTIAELAKKIWGWITRQLGKIKDAAKKFANMFRNAPHMIKARKSKVKEAEDEAAKMNETIKQAEKVLEEMEGVADKAAQNVADTEETIRLLDKIRDAVRSGGSISFDSDLSAANEADDGEVEEEADVSRLKALLNNITTGASNLLQKAQGLMGRIHQKIQKDQNDTADEEAGKVSLKQRFWSMLCNAAGRVANFLASIPTKAAALWGRVVRHNGVKVEQYDGPDPELG